MNQPFVDRYFSAGEDYPNVTGSDILPYGHLWSYISSTFLNGFINYVDVLKAFMVTRYEPYDKNLAEAEVFNSKKAPHTNLWSQLSDDCIILAAAKNNSQEYWFFWSDRDVSDCMIGRFVTINMRADVIVHFSDYVKFRNEEIAHSYPVKGKTKPIELNPEMFTGWINL